MNLSIRKRSVQDPRALLALYPHVTGVLGIVRRSANVQGWNPAELLDSLSVLVLLLGCFILLTSHSNRVL